MAKRKRKTVRSRSSSYVATKKKAKKARRSPVHGPALPPGFQREYGPELPPGYLANPNAGWQSDPWKSKKKYGPRLPRSIAAARGAATYRKAKGEGAKVKTATLQGLKTAVRGLKKWANRI